MGHIAAEEHTGMLEDSMSITWGGEIAIIVVLLKSSWYFTKNWFKIGVRKGTAREGVAWVSTGTKPYGSWPSDHSHIAISLTVQKEIANFIRTSILLTKSLDSSFAQQQTIIF